MCCLWHLLNLRIYLCLQILLNSFRAFSHVGLPSKFKLRPRLEACWCCDSQSGIVVPIPPLLNALVMMLIRRAYVCMNVYKLLITLHAIKKNCPFILWDQSEMKQASNTRIVLYIPFLVIHLLLLRVFLFLFFWCWSKKTLAFLREVF